MTSTTVDFMQAIKSREGVEDVFQRAGNEVIAKSQYGRCFAHLLAALKWQGDIWHLTRVLPHFADDFDLVNLFNSLAHLGYKAEPSHISLKHLDTRLFPCLFVPDDRGNHGYPYVILAKKEDMFEAYDSQSDRIVTIDPSVMTKGTVYFFTQLSNDELYYDQMTENVDPSPKRWFRQLFSKLRPLIRYALVVSLFINLIGGVIAPLFAMVVYDKVISVKALDSLIGLTFGVVVIVGVDYVLRVLRQRLFSWYGTRIDAMVSPAILERLISLPPRVTESSSISSQVSRVRDFDAIREFFTGPLVLSVFEAPFVVIIIIAIAAIAGNLAFIPLVLILLYICAGFILYPRVRDVIEENARSSSKRHRLIIESVEKIKQIKAFGHHESWVDQCRSASGSAAFTSFKSAFLTSVLEMIAYALYVLGGLGTLVYGIHLVISGQITTGALIASMILVWRIITPLQVIFTSMSVFIHLKNSVLQVHRLLLLKPEQPAIKVFAKAPKAAPSIEFSDLTLRHQNNSKTTFSGLNCAINPGEIVMVVGRNGAGRSSLIKLVNGMYTPQLGSVKINGIDLRQYDISEIRRTIGYVPHTTELFYGTLAQNLRISNPAATEEEMKEVLQNLGCWSTVEGYNEGLHYRIGDTKTEWLPSSFAFQLSLARAILRNAPLMLVDQAPHSFIYSDAFKYYINCLDSWRGQKTVLMVAQTEEMLSHADRVLYTVGDGRVLMGAPQEIIKVVKQQFGHDFDK